MRVNVDSSVITDPRFRVLGKRLGVSWREAVGSCMLVWMACYERRSERLSIEEIDIAAELDGFAAAMMGVGLAHVDKESQQSVVVHGVLERIKFLNKQRVRGAKGAKARWEDPPQTNAIAVSEANAMADGMANAMACAMPDAMADGMANGIANAIGEPMAYSLSLSLSPSLSPSTDKSLKNEGALPPPTASPGMNPTNNTTDLGLYWCFRTRAIGRKPTAQDVTAALDAMIQSGAVTLDEVRAAWTSGQFDWSQTFGVWRTAMQRAKEGKDAKRARQPPDEPSLPTIKEVREREAARLAELMKGGR